MLLEIVNVALILASWFLQRDILHTKYSRVLRVLYWDKPTVQYLIPSLFWIVLLGSTRHSLQETNGGPCVTPTTYFKSLILAATPVNPNSRMKDGISQWD